MADDMNTTSDHTTERKIIHRTRGKAYGRITRLVSPSELGEMIKPFVFLDAFGGPVNSGSGFGWHPHSGIATLSLLLEGREWIEETSGERHELEADGVEWMRAGGGVWHTGGSLSDKPGDDFVGSINSDSQQSSPRDERVRRRRSPAFS